MELSSENCQIIEIVYRFISIDYNNIRYYIISQSEFDVAYKTVGWIDYKRERFDIENEY